jgi:hypothetical protein
LPLERIARGLKRGGGDGDRDPDPGGHRKAMAGPA